MTIWIMPEKEGQSVCSSSKATNTMSLPQTRKLVRSRAPLSNRKEGRRVHEQRSRGQRSMNPHHCLKVYLVEELQQSKLGDKGT